MVTEISGVKDNLRGIGHEVPTREGRWTCVGNELPALPGYLRLRSRIRLTVEYAGNRGVSLMFHIASRC